MHVTVDIYAQAFFIFNRSFKKERIGNMWFHHKSINGENAECKKVYIIAIMSPTVISGRPYFPALFEFEFYLYL